MRSPPEGSRSEEIGRNRKIGRKEISPIAKHDIRRRPLFRRKQRLGRGPSAVRSGAGASPKITACLIARDEEGTIGSCLESLSGAVDEIVVLDTGSRDRTKRVARRHGARVADFPWVDDFSAARNHALDLARGEWILVVDCDEELSGPSRDRLRETVRDCSADGFSVELVNRESPAALSDSDDADIPGARWLALRLFRRDSGIRYRGRIHERPIFPDAGEHRVEEARGITVLHSGYQNAADRGAKAERNLRLIDTALAETPEDDLVTRSLYQFYKAFGSPPPERDRRVAAWVELVEAERALQQPPVSPWIPSGLAQHAWWLSDHRRHPEAEVRARRLLARFGPSPPLFLAVARARAAAGDYEAAEEAAAEILADEPEIAAPYRHFPLDVALVRRRAHYLRAEIGERLGRLEEAQAVYARLVEIDPGHLPAVLRLACVQVQRERFAEAVETLHAHPRIAEQKLPEIDCLCLALSLIVNSPRAAGLEQRVRQWSPRSEVAARFLDRFDNHTPDSPWRMSDFPDIHEGLRVSLP